MAKIALVSLNTGSGCPPVGLVQYGTWLQKQGHEVDILDKNYPNNFKKLDYDQIGISAMTVNYGEAKLYGKWLKENTKAKVIIGGVHISTCPESFDPECFDEMVIGEGEKYQELDDLPLPNWDLIDQRYFKPSFNTTFAERGIEGVMLTSRGCPYRCRFCSTQAFWGNKVRFHSAERVVRMIDDLWVRGVTHIQIWDDLFTINKERLKAIIKEDLPDIKFNCQPRADLIDDEMCELLKEIGVTTCIFGFESGNDRVLKYLKRDTCTTQDNYKAIEICHRHGLKVQGSVMLGSPNETLKEMNDTYEFVKWCAFNGVQRIWSFVATPFPKTEWWANQDVNECSHQNINNPLLLNPDISKKDFKKMMNKIGFIENIFKFKKLGGLIRATIKRTCAN